MLIYANGYMRMYYVYVFTFIQKKLDAQQPQQPQGAMIYAVVDKTKKQQDVSRPIHCHLILGVHTYTFVGIIIMKTELFVHLA